MGDGAGLTYREMAEYVGTQMARLHEEMDAHDTWHRKQLENQITAVGQSRAAIVTQILSAAGVLVTAASWLIRLR